MKNHKFQYPGILSCVLLLAGLIISMQTALAQSFCVFDPLGAQGDYYSLFKDYQVAAKRWGVDIDLKPYVDDNKLNDAFKSGQCDMASMIGMRARLFNQFTGTLDSPGTIENYAQEREVMALMASPVLARYMVSGPYEMVGVVPIGAAYPVVNDRKINSLAAGAGKKVGIMGWDKTQAMIADEFHVTPVPLELSAFGSQFSAGKIDMIVVPMALYKPLELNKSIGSIGGIVRRPLFQFTMQLMAHTDKFPPGFGQQSREFMRLQVDHALGVIRNTEAEVDNRQWIYALHNEIVEWKDSMRVALAHMVKNGYFDKRMLTLLQRVRCRSTPDSDECVQARQDTAAGTPNPH